GPPVARSIRSTLPPREFRSWARDARAVSPVPTSRAPSGATVGRQPEWRPDWLIGSPPTSGSATREADVPSVDSCQVTSRTSGRRSRRARGSVPRNRPARPPRRRPPPTSAPTPAYRPSCRRGGERVVGCPPLDTVAVMPPSYLRFPHVHGDTIVFTAEDDVWTAPLSGGRAYRITADDVPVAYPRLSPDGARVAWTSWKNGAPETYVSDVDGGGVQRLTY